MRTQVLKLTNNIARKPLPSSATVTEKGGQFFVSGSHTYNDEGVYTITVSIPRTTGTGGPITTAAELNSRVAVGLCSSLN